MHTLQGSAKEWSLGCANPASWLPLAAEGEFTQPRDHSFAQLCTYPFFFPFPLVAPKALTRRVKSLAQSQKLTAADRKKRR